MRRDMIEATLTSRPVEKADIPRICRFPASLDELAFMFRNPSFPLTPDALQESMRERQDSTVALVNGKVAGFANFYGCIPGDSCSIGNVIVDPTQRGKGVAKFLIETMVGIAIEKHQAQTVKLVCFNQNVSGLLLYAKLGFTPFAIEERADARGNRVAAIRMAVSADDWLR